MHSIDAFNKLISDNGICNNIKIITAVREPISQTLSSLYQLLGSLCTDSKTYLSLLDKLFPFEKSAIIKNGGDIQYIFDKFINLFVNVEHFINQFSSKIVDIKKEPFDKEKGYTIIKDGNIEVFVYQLEKMNDCAREIAEFVGGNFTEWEMANIADDKWIANSYKQAQKEIKISQEYFDKCFESSYVHHFYSEKDIEKFKKHWGTHIRK